MSDPQLAYTLFFGKLSQIYDVCFPIRTFRKTYISRKPWISENLSRSIKTKNRLMAKSKKQPYNMKLESKYLEYKKTLQKTMRFAERKHYDDLFAQYKCDLVKSWNVMKQLINRKKCFKPPKYFIVNEKKTFHSKDIADGFNKFYVNLGASLAKKIPTTNIDPITFLKRSIHENILFSVVTEKELIDLLKNMKSASSGWDGLSPHIIKLTSHFFTKPLLHICNLSLSCGVFPSELKIAKVLPLYKSGDDVQLVNHRPVSILPVFSKVLERLMYDRVTEFLKNHLYKYQFGFRKKHSTSIALMVLVDKITKAMLDGEYVLGVFIDFSKAFDTVNHQILLKKTLALWHQRLSS